jgi:uncharacterized protein YfkK (UPF0435 family)
MAEPLSLVRPMENPLYDDNYLVISHKNIEGLHDIINLLSRQYVLSENEIHAFLDQLKFERTKKQ